MKAALYTRVSSDMQAEGGFSLDEQLNVCQQLAAREGWEIVKHYSDVASGRTAERAEFQQMLADAEQGLFERLIVHDTDRFSRSVLDAHNALERLSACGVELVPLRENFDLTTADGKLVFGIKTLNAQYFSERLGEEVAKGIRGRARAGYWLGQVPFGYTVPYPKKHGGDGMARVDPQAAEGVRLAFETYARGVYSDADIARVLNEAGYRPVGRGNRALPFWSKDSIRFLLQNRFYCGDVSCKGAGFPGKHEPIISEELFDRCREVRVKKRAKYGGSAPSKSRDYALGGVARCAQCGTRMRGSGKTADGKYHYRCPGKTKGLQCEQGYVDAEAAEEAVGSFVTAIEIPEHWKREIEKAVGEECGTAKDYEREARRIDEQLERNKNLYRWGDMGEEEYKQERDSLRAKKAALKPPETGDQEAVVELLQGGFGSIWAEATLIERKHFVHSLFENVYLDSEAEGGPVTHVEPVAACAAVFEHFATFVSDGRLPRPIATILQIASIPSCSRAVAGCGWGDAGD